MTLSPLGSVFTRAELCKHPHDFQSADGCVCACVRSKLGTREDTFLLSTLSTYAKLPATRFGTMLFHPSSPTTRTLCPATLPNLEN